jgi:hypothetical protein
LTLHVTAVFDVPVTVAVKEVVCEALSVAVVGVTVTVMLLLLEFPPPHPRRNAAETIKSAVAVATAIRRRADVIGLPQIPLEPCNKLFVRIDFKCDIRSCTSPPWHENWLDPRINGSSPNTKLRFAYELLAQGSEP